MADVTAPEPIVVGYVNIYDVDGYIRVAYSAYDETSQNYYLREWWNDLEDTDVQSMELMRAFQVLERLPFSGFATDKDQTSQFPRNGASEVPDDVKWAQIEIMLLKVRKTAVSADGERAVLRAQGVKSYSLGDLSETLADGSSSPFDIENTVLADPVVSGLLRRYISGSVAVC